MPVTNFDLRVSRIAVAEWWFFGGQYVNGDVATNIKSLSTGTQKAGEESKSGFKEKTWTYFKYGVFPDSNDWKSFKSSAWSAGFISYCMRQGGAGVNFPYGVSHSTYVNQAVRNTLAGLNSNTITAHSKTGMAPAVGDLLWKYGYETHSTWTHEELVAHVKSGGGGYNSHCDLVVDVDYQSKVLFAIGGNVSDRVLRFKIKLDDDGLIQTDRYATVIRNNITEQIDI